MMALEIADSKPRLLDSKKIPTLLTYLPTPSSSINPSIHSLPHFFSFCLRAASTFRLSILVSILTQNAGSQLVKSIFWNAVCIWIKRRNIITKRLWACFYNAVVMCLTKCYCRMLLNIFLAHCYTGNWCGGFNSSGVGSIDPLIMPLTLLTP